MKTRTHQTSLKRTSCAFLSAAILMVFASGGSLFAQSSKQDHKNILFEMNIDEVTCVYKKPAVKNEEGDCKKAYYLTESEIVIVGESGFKSPERLVAIINQQVKLESITARLEAPSVNLFQLYFAILEDSGSQKRKNRAQKMEG